MLREDSLDENALMESLNQNNEWTDRLRTRQSNVSKKTSLRTSESSLSTDFSSELEEVYEQFSKWLHDPIIETDSGTKRKRELDTRDLAVLEFAGSLLKRTLSESFAGVPLTDGCDNDATANMNEYSRKEKIVLNAKSLSLELARHKHRLAAQLVPGDFSQYLHLLLVLLNYLFYFFIIIDFISR